MHITLITLPLNEAGRVGLPTTINYGIYSIIIDKQGIREI